MGVKLCAWETPNPERLTETLSSELGDLIGPASPFDSSLSFDERDAARPGISNLTGETGSHLYLVNPSIMSEAGDGTVELLAPVLSNTFRTS